MAKINQPVPEFKAEAFHNGEVCPAAWEEGDQTLTPSLDLVGKI